MGVRFALIPPSPPHWDNTYTEVTVFREHELSEQGIRFITVVIDEDCEVVTAYDEDDVPIALTPEEEDFAVRMVRMGLAE